MQAQIGKWGNSLAIRIPGLCAKELNLQEGMHLDISLVEGGLLLRPRRRKYTLEELLAGITDDNLPDAWDTGPAVGKEVW